MVQLIMPALQISITAMCVGHTMLSIREDATIVEKDSNRLDHKNLVQKVVVLRVAGLRVAGHRWVACRLGEVCRMMMMMRVSDV